MEQATCSVEECSQPAYARGVCRNCYRRAWYRGTHAELPKQPVVTMHIVSGVDPETRTGVCSLCGPVRANWRSGRNYWECQTVRKRHRARVTPEQKRNERYKAKYGITLEQYNEMYATVGGLCEICQDPLPLLQVDHHHGSGEIRGLLCPPCNKGLGQFKDSLTVLTSAMNYLSGRASA